MTRFGWPTADNSAKPCTNQPEMKDRQYCSKCANLTVPCDRNRIKPSRQMDVKPAVFQEYT